MLRKSTTSTTHSETALAFRSVFINRIYWIGPTRRLGWISAQGCHLQRSIYIIYSQYGVFRILRWVPAWYITKGKQIAQVKITCSSASISRSGVCWFTRSFSVIRTWYRLITLLSLRSYVTLHQSYQMNRLHLRLRGFHYNTFAIFLLVYLVSKRVASWSLLSPCLYSCMSYSVPYIFHVFVSV